MDENTQAKFEERLKELLNAAKKKKNVLEYQEISDFFTDMTLEEEQFDKILETLEQNNVDVLRITEDDDVDDEEIILTEEDEVMWRTSTYPCRTASVSRILSGCT